MQISTHTLRRLAALAAAIGAAGIAAPMVQADTDGTLLTRAAKTAEQSWLPKNLTYPGEGFTAPSSVQAGGLNGFGVPNDLTYPGEGFTAPSSVQGSGLNEFGVPTDLTYPGEGIAAPLPQAVTVQAPQGNGFDFADAGVGAGVALGSMMLLVAAALATRRRRRLAES